MADEAKSDFYASYGAFKEYATPGLRPKHVKRFDRLFWIPAACDPAMAVLEIGCGLGQFLLYLREKGVADFLGIDQDPQLEVHIPEQVRDHFRIADVWQFLESGIEPGRFDRIALFDVLEHFASEDGVTLLSGLRGLLKPGGRVVVKVPNAASPWGAQYQYGDLTHRTAFAPGSLRQIAVAAGLVCLGCHPEAEGSPIRRFFDKALHGFLSHVLLAPPEVWTANVIAVFERPDE